MSKYTGAERDRLLTILKRVDAWAQRLPDCEPMGDILIDIRNALAKPENSAEKDDLLEPYETIANQGKTG